VIAQRIKDRPSQRALRSLDHVWVMPDDEVRAVPDKHRTRFAAPYRRGTLVRRAARDRRERLAARDRRERLAARDRRERLAARDGREKLTARDRRERPSAARHSSSGAYWRKHAV